MLSERELKHLSKLINVSDVSYLTEAEVIYILAKRLIDLELEVSILKGKDNG